MERRRRLHEELISRLPSEEIIIPVDFDVSSLKRSNRFVLPRGSGYLTRIPPASYSDTTDFMHLRPLPDSFLPGLPQTVYALGTIGDGSCFPHSVLAAISQGYRDSLMDPNRLQRCHTAAGILRCALLQLADEDEWLRTLRREQEVARNSNTLPQAVEQAKQISFKQHQKQACRISAWFDEPLIRFMRRKLGMNLIVFDAVGGYRPVPGLCSLEGDRESMFDRPLVLILWEARQHFCLLGVAVGLSDDLTQVDLRTFFRPDLSADDRLVAELIYDLF